jgi:hypothetical protein
VENGKQKIAHSRGFGENVHPTCPQNFDLKTFKASGVKVAYDAMFGAGQVQERF